MKNACLALFLMSFIGPMAFGQTIHRTRSKLSRTQSESAGPSQIHGTVVLSTLSIDGADAHVPQGAVNAVFFEPRVLYDVKSDLSVYGALPLTYYNPSGGSYFNSIGRPELGAFKTVSSNDDFSWGAGLNLKLPLYTLNQPAGAPAIFVEPMRVWEVAPGAAATYTVPGSTTRMALAFNLAYDTPADFSFSTTNASGLPQAIDGERFPLMTRATLNFSHDSGKLTVGLAFHAANWLASGDILSAGNVYRTVSPLDLSRGEVYGVYRFTPKTTASFSASRGFKTSNDPATFAVFDDPVQVSSAAIGFGISQLF